MKKVEGRIVQSSRNPALVSLRDSNRESIKRALTDADFRPGEPVVVVSKKDFEKLQAGGD